MPREVKYFIHPAVGIARVGDSAREFYIAPETPGTFQHPVECYEMDKAQYDESAQENATLDDGYELDHRMVALSRTYRDRFGGVRRQGARFRVFEYYYAHGEFDSEGRRNMPTSIRELTSEEADITWSVQVANMKTIVPVTRDTVGLMYQAYAEAFRYVNRSVEVTIQGVNKGRDISSAISVERSFSRTTASAEIPAEYVTKAASLSSLKLGTLLTDEQGHLIFLGGRGKTDKLEDAAGTSSAEEGGDMRAKGWFDDLSDGVVKASIFIKKEMDGSSPPSPREVDAEDVYPASVICGIPKFSGSILPLISLYDRAEDIVYSKGNIPTDRNSRLYASYIQPILQNVDIMQHVSKDIRDNHIGSILSRVHSGSLAPANLYALVNKKETIFGLEEASLTSGRMPLLYGRIENDKPRYISFTSRQIEYFNTWSSATTAVNYSSLTPDMYSAHIYDGFPAIEEGEIDPRDLDRAHMETIVAGGYGPGVEVNRISAYKSEDTEEETEQSTASGGDAVLADLASSGGDPYITKYFDSYYSMGITMNPYGIWTRPANNSSIGTQPPVYFLRVDTDDVKPGYLTYNLPVPWHIDIHECGERWWPSAVPTSVWRCNDSDYTSYIPERTWTDSLYTHYGFDKHFDVLNHWTEYGFIKEKGDLVTPCSNSSAPDYLLDEEHIPDDE